MAALRPATPADWPGIAALLEAAHLPLAGASGHLDSFVVATDEGGRVVAAGGLEIHGSAGLLRSLVAESRGAGIGSSIVHRLIGEARARGVTDLVLLTTTAAGFFPRFGFVVTTRDQVPEALQASEEFRGACPASATVMRLSLS